MRELVNKYADIVTNPDKPVARDIKHKIDLLDPVKPITHHRLQGISGRKLNKMQKNLKKYLEKGWIQSNTSHYNHPILFIHKKTMELRVYVDYRNFNNNTIINRYPIPRIDATLDKLDHAIFRKIDLTRSYHQVEMHPDHPQRTVF